MGRINVLSKEIAELIAAGEVIERPASIVKELLENSIDADSTSVTVEIKNGGITYIRVTDNGCGMEPDDLSIAFLRHATSKIKESIDLDSIGTLGFRGEALASISAVSRMEVISKTKSMQFGCRSELQGGEQIDFGEVGCPDGTTVIVKDLFYNIPARLKFLKKNTSEANSINGIMDKLALSHPELAVKLISDGKIKLNTPGNGDLLSAIHAVFGSELSANLLAVSYEQNGMSVNGYITPPGESRSNRGMQHFFVNSRYVRSKTCLVSLEEGYKSTLMVGRYPSCVLNIQMPFDVVDVNVHPAKIEVRFVNERDVFNVVYFAVKSALTKQNILKYPLSEPISRGVLPVSSFEEAETEQLTQATVESYTPTVADEKSNYVEIMSTTESKNNPFGITATEPIITVPFIHRSPPVTMKKAVTTQNISNVASSQAEYNVSKKAIDRCAEDTKSVAQIVPIETFSDEASEAVETEIVPTKKEILPNVKVIGELFGTYMLFEAEDIFYLLDKHAAHERILYEQLKKSISQESSQALITPVVVALSAEESEALLEKSEECHRLGFYYEEFGNHSIIVREIPMYLPSYAVALTVTDLAKRILEARTELLVNRFEEILHSMACRAAVKANDKTDISELTELLRILYENDELRNCPHGRPVAIAMTKKELEKKFGRS